MNRFALSPKKLDKFKSGLLGFRAVAVAVNWEMSRLWLVYLDDETWRRIF